jgi:hypothetical protein
VAGKRWWFRSTRISPPMRRARKQSGRDFHPEESTLRNLYQQWRSKWKKSPTKRPFHTHSFPPHSRIAKTLRNSDTSIAPPSWASRLTCKDRLKGRVLCERGIETEKSKVNLIGEAERYDVTFGDSSVSFYPQTSQYDHKIHLFAWQVISCNLGHP